MLEKSTEEILKEREMKKEEDKKEKEKRKKEYEEAAKRRKKLLGTAEELSLKLGNKSTEWYLNTYFLGSLLFIFIVINIILIIYKSKRFSLDKIPVISLKNISEHNSASNWKQNITNFWKGESMADAKKLMGVLFSSHANLNKCFYEENLEIPESFDTRIKWPECKLPPTSEVKGCAGSYANNIVSVFAEKLCIDSPEHKLIPLSSQELISCDFINKGCEGGYVNIALQYLQRNGVTTEQCFPAKLNAKCSNMCKNPEKFKPESFCVIFGADYIKKEIFLNGPIVSVMEMYTDFLTYSSGIYTKGQNVTKFTGMHSVKIIGWGIEKASEGEDKEGKKYWLVENTWGDDWGDKGVAKVEEGQDFFFEKYAFSILNKNEHFEMKKKFEEYQNKLRKEKNLTQS